MRIYLLIVSITLFISLGSIICYPGRFPDEKTDPERLLHFQKALDELTGAGKINIERRIAFDHFKDLMEMKQTRQEEQRQTTAPAEKNAKSMRANTG